MIDDGDVELTVRERLRGLRRAMGYSLDDLARQSHLSASTISRIENGKRSISLDVLLPLVGALHVSLDTLLDLSSDDDVVIRPIASHSGKHTVWLLNRSSGRTTAIKMRLHPVKRRPPQKVHNGYDWLFVTEGRVKLSLGSREITVEAGEAAEFSTMTPHAVTAIDRPAELIMVFDSDGRRAHVHNAPSDSSGE